MTKTAPANDSQKKIRAILENLSRDEQKLLSAVIAVEQDNLVTQKPSGVNDDLWRALTETIR